LQKPFWTESGKKSALPENEKKTAEPLHPKKYGGGQAPNKHCQAQLKARKARPKSTRSEWAQGGLSDKKRSKPFSHWGQTGIFAKKNQGVDQGNSDYESPGWAGRVGGEGRELLRKGKTSNFPGVKPEKKESRNGKKRQVKTGNKKNGDMGSHRRGKSF